MLAILVVFRSGSNPLPYSNSNFPSKFQISQDKVKVMEEIHSARRSDANIGSNHCSRVFNPILTMSWYSIKNPQKWPLVRSLANLSKICLETLDSSMNHQYDPNRQ